jgi:hypothetical protein
MDECLQTAMNARKITGDQGRAAQAEYRSRLEARRSEGLPEEEAARLAGEDLMASTQKETAARARRAVADLQAFRRIKNDLLATSQAGDGLPLLMEFNDTAHSTNWKGESFRGFRDGLVRYINGKIRRTLQELGPDWKGASLNPALMDDWVAELHGEDSGNAAAKAIARPVMEAKEELRQMANALGADIGKLDDHGLPHRHDAQRLRSAGFAAWRDEIFDKVAWHRIVDHGTGKAFVADAGARPNRAAADAFMKRVYDEITTRGWQNREPSSRPGSRALYARLGEHRVLHFNTSKDWLAYNRKFGVSDPFSAMTDHLHRLATDVAMMRRFGSNPRAGLEFAVQVETKRAATSLDQNIEDRVRRRASLAQTMMFHADGSANAPIDAYWASFLSGTRAVLTSAQLGSSVISSVTDIATIRAASRVLGMNPDNVFSRMTRIATGEERQFLASQGYVADSLADAGAAHSRYFGEMVAPEFAQFLSSATMRWTGQTYWTDMTRLAFMGEFAAMLGQEAKKSFANINPHLRRVMAARGISELDWDNFRRADVGLFRPEGEALFLSPTYWLEHQTNMARADAQDLAFRIQMMMDEQLEIAIPTASLEGRARTLGQTRAGTISGELLRSVAMYKGFTLSFTLNQVRRFNNLPDGMNRWGYAARLGAGLIVLGGVAIQLKEIAKGRDPRPLDTKFLLAAIFQSGGLGIFGDFFSSETSRTGGGLAETIAGPVVGAASDVIGVAARGVSSIFNDETFRPGREAANFFRYNTPFLSSAWYARTAYERMVIDQLIWLLDPEAQNYLGRRDDSRTRSYGNEPVWRSGEVLPERLPNAMAMFGVRD